MLYKLAKNASILSFFTFLHLISRTENKCGPQGSIFAVCLFSSYINDMPEIFDNPSFLYAENKKIIEN